jgi:hypothetical protein
MERYPVDPVRLDCRRTMGPVTIDGRLSEDAWKRAQWSEPFVDIVTGEAAWFVTRCAFLWDDEALYVGMHAEETDIRADLRERDSKVWFDNDLEIFIAGKDAYYEFEVNAFGTIYEVFWIWNEHVQPGGRYHGLPEFDPARHPLLMLDGVGGHVHPRGERHGFLDWDYPGLEHAVHLDGVVNSLQGMDRAWSLEVKLPWKGLQPLADGRSLPPLDGDIWRMDCSRFQKVTRDGTPLDPSAGWCLNRHGHYDSHIPEAFPYITFRR